ncbi:MAG: CAP domain-containing protein [Methanoregulaceae archaeon]|nr:CAP domain-containing protein [Methanoregulaceae archaeon]
MEGLADEANGSPAAGITVDVVSGPPGAAAMEPGISPDALTATFRGIVIRRNGVKIFPTWVQKTTSLELLPKDMVREKMLVRVTGRDGILSYAVTGRQTQTWPLTKGLWYEVNSWQKFVNSGNYNVVVTVKIPGTTVKNSRTIREKVAYLTRVPLDTASIERWIYIYSNQERLNRGLSEYWEDGVDCVCHCGFTPPRVDSDGVQAGASRPHSEDMAQNNFFDHIGSSGSSVYDRIAAVLNRCDLGGSPPTAWGENIAWWPQNDGDTAESIAKDIVNAWVNNDAASNWGHRFNILDGINSDIYPGWHNPPRGYQRMAVGVVSSFSYQGNNDLVYIATQDFYKGGCGCR